MGKRVKVSDDLGLIGCRLFPEIKMRAYKGHQTKEAHSVTKVEEEVKIGDTCNGFNLFPKMNCKVRITFAKK